MRKLRVGCLVFLCAMAALTSLGAGTASATRFCSTSVNPCPMANRWNATTTVASAVSTPAQIITSLGTISCQKSTLGGKTTGSGGGLGVAVTEEFSTFMMEECKVGTTACTMTVSALPYAGEVNWTANFDGLLKISNGGMGNPIVLAECGALIKCTFTTPLAELEVKGGVTALLIANAIMLSRQGALCPTQAKLKATYEVSSPGPLNITKE